MRKIPGELYKNIVNTMPVCCVDIVIYQNGRVLLLKRVNEPEKGNWWVPGGRIYKNETIEDAVRRKVREETGLNTAKIKRIGIYEYFSNSANFGVVSGTHSIVFGYLAELEPEKKGIILDKTSESYKWIDKIEQDLEEYVKKIIKDSRVFEKS